MQTRHQDLADGLPHPVSAATPVLPLVSVIVVNHDYGRFLVDAIGSVFAQSYPRVECVVVDNGSTDETPAVLAACAARHPNLRVLRRETNGGQTLACLEGLAASHGPYVIFLDADDMLLPDCVATHIAVHLSSRVHVGFTSGDMLQVVEGQTIVGSNELTRAFIAKERVSAEGLLRPSAAALGALLPRAQALVGHAYPVPRTHTDWLWAPTSGNCFRRDALALLCDGENLPRLASQTDLYLALAVNVVCGSILVDEPVFAYRLHGTNVFSNRAQLQGLPNFDPRRAAVQGRLARELIIEQLVGHVDRFVPEPWMIWHLLAILRKIDVPVDEAGAWHGGSTAGLALARNFATVRAAGGFKPVFDFLMRAAPLRSKLRLLLTGRPLPGARG